MSHNDRSLGGLFFFSLWTLGWTVGVLCIDFAVARVIFLQSRTTRFAKTDGEILASEVAEEVDEGTTYHPTAHHEYTVAGKRYESRQLRYGSDAGSRRWTHNLVASLPAGAVRPVYYDPARPAEAVLLPGLEFGDLMPTVFMIPFNVIMLGSCVGLWQSVRRQPTQLPWGTLQLPTANGEMLRLPGVSAWTAAAAAVGVSGFGLTFLLLFLSAHHGSPGLVIGCWALTLIAGVWAAHWAKSKNVSGEFDLEIDDVRRMVILPGSEAAPTDRESLHIKELAGAEIADESHKDSDGDEVYKFATLLVARDGRKLRIHEWDNLEDAALLDGWLTRRLGLEQRVEV